MNLSRRLWWGISGSAFIAVVATSSIAWFTAHSLLIGDVDQELRERATRTAQMPWIPLRFTKQRSRRHIEHFFLYLGNPQAAARYKTENWSGEFPTHLTADDQIEQLQLSDGRVFRVIQIPVATGVGNSSDPTTLAPFSEDDATHLDEKTADSVQPPPDKSKHGRPDWRQAPPDFKIEAGTVLLMAADISALNDDLYNLRNLLIAVGSVVCCAAFFIAARLRDGLLAPLRTLGTAIDNLEHDNIEARILLSQLPHTLPSELMHITQRLNDLLERLAASRKRERRSIGDIAHELRTPLAALRSELEFAISAGDIPSQRAGFLQQQVQALHDRIDGLLLLMRLEGGHQQLHYRCISIAELLSDAWSPHANSGQQLEIIGDQDAEINGDPQLLSMLMANIFNNACVYNATPVQPIRLTLTQTPRHLHLCLGNYCALEAGNYQQAFDPFWRHDLARQQTDAHHGLGLALVQRIAHAHQAQVNAHVTAAGIFELALDWPHNQQHQQHPQHQPTATEPHASQATSG